MSVCLEKRTFAEMEGVVSLMKIKKLVVFAAKNIMVYIVNKVIQFLYITKNSEDIKLKIYILYSKYDPFFNLAIIK